MTLSTPYSDLEIHESLDALDSQFVENTTTTRRDLRIDVQQDLIECNSVIVHGFLLVSERLEHIGGHLKSMCDLVAEMQSRHEELKTNNYPIVTESAHILSQQIETRRKDLILRAFNERFMISRDDIAMVSNSVDPVDDHFFSILGALKQTHSDCQFLLANGNDRVGTEIMNDMNTHLNNAYQRLFRWIQRELKHLSLEGSQGDRHIRKALYVLAERPILLQNCLDSFAENRQKVLLESFHAALTGAGVHSSTTKPIEFHAHDPLRYVGDILAWLHSTAVGEQESLEVLFIPPKSAVDDSRIEHTDLESRGSSVGESLSLLVDKSLKAIYRPLKTSIEQAISSQESSTLSYRLANLIKFYRLTFGTLLGGSSLAHETVQSTEDFALQQFRNIVNDHVRSSKSDALSVDPKLCVPTFLEQALEELSSLMECYAASLAPDGISGEEFSKVLDVALDPYLLPCVEAARKLSPDAQDVFNLNCLLAAHSTLQPFSTFTSARLAKLDQHIERHVAALVGAQSDHFLHTSGVYPLVRELSERRPTSTSQLVQSSPFSTTSLREISQKLDQFLPSACLDAREKLRNLTSPRLIHEIVERAADQYIAEFERVDDAVMRWLSSHADLERDSIWVRGVEDVRVLLR